LIKHGYKSAGFCGLNDYKGTKIYPKADAKPPAAR